MRTAPLLALFLVLAPTAAFGQRRPFIRAEVETVKTNQPIPAGPAIGGLSVDERGRFYVATFRRRVYRIELDGRVTLLTSAFREASGNAIDNNGELLQSEFRNNQLFRVHENGSRTLIANTGLSRPVGVAVDVDDHIFVVNFGNDTVSRIDPRGEVTLFSDDPLLNGPNGITIDELGDVYVANFSNNLLLRIDKAGRAHVVAAVGIGQNNAHVASLAGKLYVSTIWTHQIYEVSKSGHVELLVGTGSPGTRDGFAPHQALLYHPNGVAAGRSNRVLYANNYIGRMGGFNNTISVRSIHIRR